MHGRWLTSWCRTKHQHLHCLLRAHQQACQVRGQGDYVYSNSICVSFASLHVYYTSTLNTCWRVDTNRPENQVRAKGHPKCAESRSSEKHPFPSPCRIFSRIGNLLPTEPQMLVPHFHTSVMWLGNSFQFWKSKQAKFVFPGFFKALPHPAILGCFECKISPPPHKLMYLKIWFLDGGSLGKSCGFLSNWGQASG